MADWTTSPEYDAAVNRSAARAAALPHEPCPRCKTSVRAEPGEAPYGFRCYALRQATGGGCGRERAQAMNISYPIIVKDPPEPGLTTLACCPPLGIQTHGATEAEAVEALRAAVNGIFSAAMQGRSTLVITMDCVPDGWRGSKVP